ncbi:LysR family transcriptional regulator [Pseudomonas syringae]|uniref:LysR family transcriptional regulator n=1 Tax=Pseudomonas syringae TaxID=317 RepID=UPI0005CABE1F|nr:LysR family transcriptional regulator [Pseudomonas syringae]KWS85721.1 LysR family transcriptional regulator [Pseudomonas syringae pv. daphniphylli]
MDSVVFGQVTVFHAIAAEGSITGAARRLGVGLPAVSKSLKLLETKMGVPLFNRTTRRLEITEAGELLLTSTADAMQSLSYAIESVQDLGHTPSGTVRITAARFAYQCILKSALERLRNAYPHINLEISIYDGTIDILDHGFDLGIRFGDRLEEGMVARRLMEPFREGLYVSGAYIRRHGLPCDISELFRHQLIGYRFMTSNRMLPLILNKNGQEVTVDMPASIITNDIEVTADCIRRGMGIGRLFEPVHTLLPDRDSFIPVLQDYWRLYPAVYLYFPKNSQRAKRIRAVVDFLVKGSVVS